jgi:hypothetical protein
MKEDVAAIVPPTCTVRTVINGVMSFLEEICGRWQFGICH